MTHGHSFGIGRQFRPSRTLQRLIQSQKMTTTLPASRHTRAADQLRPVRITRNYTMHAEGSVLIAVSYTHLTLPTICSV